MKFVLFLTLFIFNSVYADDMVDLKGGWHCQMSDEKKICTTHKGKLFLNIFSYHPQSNLVDLPKDSIPCIKFKVEFHNHDKIHMPAFFENITYDPTDGSKGGVGFDSLSEDGHSAETLRCASNEDLSSFYKIIKEHVNMYYKDTERRIQIPLNDPDGALLSYLDIKPQKEEGVDDISVEDTDITTKEASEKKIETSSKSKKTMKK